MSDKQIEAVSTRLIDLAPAEAKEALLKSESYFDFDLPTYFDFSPMLKGIVAKLAGAPLASIWNSNPADYEGVNHIIFHSKDGMYAWRPQELIHPVIYAAIVDHLTNHDAWSLIRSHFDKCAANPNIECVR